MMAACEIFGRTTDLHVVQCSVGVHLEAKVPHAYICRVHMPMFLVSILSRS